MEHSALHALELLGQIVCLGGAFFVLGLIRPAVRRAGGNVSGTGDAMIAIALRWVVIGALCAALATFLNLFVEAAETQARTVFGGVDFALTYRFAIYTRVGKLTLERIGVLLLTAAIAKFVRIGKWWLILLGTMTAIELTSLVSHAAAQPESRAILLVAQITHVTAAALWVGVLIHLLVAQRNLVRNGASMTLGQSASSPRLSPPLRGREGGQNPPPYVSYGAEGNPSPDVGGYEIGLLAEVVRRFSPVALAVTSLLGISGVWMICRFLVEAPALVTSAYGLTLIVKLLLLTPAIYAGYMNFRVIRPALLDLSGGNSSSGEITAKRKNLLERFGRLLELEVTSGVLVITAAGILASVSPPGAAGAYRLTDAQAHAILHAHLPVTNIVNPEKFYGAAERTTDDLHYAEFTHNWSGVMVCLLGLGWFIQGVGGTAGKWAGRCWPLLLVPFAIFIALAADPEVWLFRLVSPLQVLRDPQLLEHQLGAAMVLILAWLGWKRHAQSDSRGPFGYGLPVVLMAGGILLLGHAHSTLNITEALTNLINVQHAVFGAFILLGGMVRWLTLRGLFPRRQGELIWPCFIIGLGVYMAFFYRETV